MENRECKICKCRDCVRNGNYCVNTPNPCLLCFCDECSDGDFAVYECNGRMTIEQVNLILELTKKGLTTEEARAIIGL